MPVSNVAIVGSTGLVGLELVSILEKRLFPVGELRLFASEKSAGRHQSFRGKTIPVFPEEAIDFEGIDLAFFMASNEVARKYVPVAVESGALVIDNSSAYRRDPEVPLVVPEVNAHRIDGHVGIIANPNCTTIQLVAGVFPIHRLSPVRRLLVSTYQSISGGGREAWDRLTGETRRFLDGEASNVAFNLWPGIDRLLEDGYYYEEDKVIAETRKILEAEDLAISATVVRVPVLRGHSVSVFMETEEPLDLADVWRALKEAPGLEVVEDPADLDSLSPVSVAGRDVVKVGRLRRDRDSERGLLMWIVADNLRKGAALNAVQIAERALGLKRIGRRAGNLHRARE